LIKVLVPILVLFPSICKEFKPDKAITKRGQLIYDVTGLSHLFASGFCSGEGDKEAFGGKNFSKSK
jgi:hypothetical protein